MKDTQRCNKCGGRITFRKNKGRAIPIHIDGSCKSTRKDEDQQQLFTKNPKYESTTTPNASCPVCGADVFYYQNSYGGKVFFDTLGPPWPVHPCTRDDKIGSAGSTNNNLTLGLNNGWLPFHIQSMTIEEDQCTIIGQKVKEFENVDLEVVIPAVEEITKKEQVGAAFIRWEEEHSRHKISLLYMKQGEQKVKDEHYIKAEPPLLQASVYGGNTL